MQPKIIKTDPPGLTTGLIDLRIGSGVFLLSAIASSTASGVLCGPISGHSGTDHGRTFAEKTLGEIKVMVRAAGALFRVKKIHEHSRGFTKHQDKSIKSRKTRKKKHDSTKIHSTPLHAAEGRVVSSELQRAANVGGAQVWGHRKP